MEQLNELGFYVLAGAPQSPVELIDEVAAGRGARPRVDVHLRTLQHQRGVHAVGRGRRGVVDARHRDRGDEPQHAPSDGHRVARDDDAPAHRRAVHARSRARDRAAVRRVRHPADHDRADRGLRRPHAPAVEGRGGVRPRRPGREVPGAAPRRVVRRGHPARLRRVRPELARARGPLLRRGRAAHVLHRRDRRTLRRDRAPRGRGKPGAIPRRCASGRVTRRSATISPSRCG